MSKKQINMAIEKSSQQKERLEEILQSIDGLICSLKMYSYHSTSTNSLGDGNEPVEYSSQEMMAKKNILFDLIPKDELYALTKKRSSNPGEYIAARN